MLQDASYEHRNKGKVTIYNFAKGYIMLKPLIDQFLIDNQNAKSKSLKYWERDNKKAQSADSLLVPTLAIKGNADIKGTYFHHSIVSQVLAWVSEDLKKKIFTVFENATVEQN